MKREVPVSKPATLWRAGGRWFQRRDKAYYAVAKKLVLAKYPRWLDDQDVEDLTDDVCQVCKDNGDASCATCEGSGVTRTPHGDQLARVDGIADWRARRDRRVMLFWDDRGQHFDTERWQTVIRRLARFMMYVDDRRGELMQRAPGLDPRDALELEHRVAKACRDWAASINSKGA